ncbi:MAG TPA: hypothetical protein PKU97_05925 [Kofleriaceae bacterium]|nr:hypothetical protein [Kofleriaceae bacterium]
MTAEMIIGNPFFVLACSPDATRLELERQAQLWLGMLELGLAAAQHYATPLGPRPRTADAVRGAVAALRDPQRRMAAELWARHATPITETPAAPAPTEDPVASRRGLPGARARLGWGG